MKLIVQIPCLDEASTLPAALAGLPAEIPGVSCLETLVVDDGSQDETAAVAQALGITHLVRHARTLGLAQAFATGLETSLRLGADIIVNTDGDNQYPAAAIPDLVAPIVAGRADIVIGNRQVERLPHFSPLKKGLQGVGSWMVRTVSGTDVPDAPSGFRAYSREAALRLNILTNYSYTLETIIQAGKMGLTVLSVPVATNSPTRPSRLQRNTWHFIKAQAGTILRLYAFYEPLRTFSYLAAPFLLAGLILLGRFGYAYVMDQNRFVQSVTIGTGLVLVGVLIFLFGIQADIASKHRQLTQEMLYRLKKLELSQLTADDGRRTADGLNQLVREGEARAANGGSGMKRG
ncbi:MAG: glycosyltransferase family 2 protein [Chloroflexi bacterium]|nr:glycosyltransferase family 2 protein [Chloroflexota bacterium]MCI0649421.1 glycosyltransferase family 2 protein [Chloroflexota bacterium]MCI0730779.1 glycosyltransferase family 2 protein [Chloroflexota bacterium]